MAKYRSKIWRMTSGLLCLAMVVVSLGVNGTSALAVGTTVFINEIHYDNASTDVGEAVEVAGPAGTDLTGWSLVFYNGSNGTVYRTEALSGTLLDQDNGYGTLAFTLPVNGIQNGSPDGIALVNNSSTVVQFLCYEGDFTAADGPAAGSVCQDIGVSEPGDTPVGHSLQLGGTGTSYEHFSWNAPAAASFGSVNGGQTFGAPPPPDVFINEIHYDNTGGDVGEAVEVAGPAGTDLSAWSLVLYNGNGGGSYGTVSLSGSIPDQDSGYGTLSFPISGIQNGSPDGLALVYNSSTLVQFLCYEGDFTAADGPAAGSVCQDIGVSEPGDTPTGHSLQLSGIGTQYGDFTWNEPAANTFGAVNTGQSFGTPPANVFINEIHYDNDGTDTGEAVEVAGDAGTDLTGWSLVFYNGNGGAPYGSVSLSGTFSDQLNGIGTQFFPYTGIQNGSPDGVALVDNSGNLIQFLCYEGTFTGVSGPADGELCQDIGVSEGSSTPVGYSLQLAGSGTVYEDFYWTAPTPSSFGDINPGQGGPGQVVVTCGGWLNTYETNAVTRGITAYDPSGMVDDFEIGSVTPTPASGTISITNEIAAIEVGGEASADVVVDGDVPAGIYEVAVTANSDSGLSGSCTFNVDVDPFLTIGEVQGVVDADDWGPYHRSPYAPPYSSGGQNDDGEWVAVQGVVYELTKEYNDYCDTCAYYGFFIQNTASTADGDPDTSDGIFVTQSYYDNLRADGGGYYTPQVGDEVILRGPVREYYSHTQLNNPFMMELVRTGVVVDDEIPAFEADPPDDIIDDSLYADIGDAYVYWERREGMRGQVPANSIVLNGRDVFASSFDSEVWVARADSVIAGRADPFERRSFRDVHPLDDIPNVEFDNENPYRILMGGFGVKAALDDTTALLAPARTYDTLLNAPIGGVYYNYGKYSIQVEEQIELNHGIDPSTNDSPTAHDRSVEYSVVLFNMENLYDYVDDAFDGCDFRGNSGCPGVDPPFDYAPASNDVYQARLAEIAEQVINDLHSPDIVMAQELEDQDVCYLDAGVYTCPAFDDQVNNADGKPDTLQELAAVIAGMGGPVYEAALDRDGADDRGIVSGYLYRTDRVELLPAQADDPVLGGSPSVIYDKPGSIPLAYNNDVQNPKVLNASLPDSVTGDTDGNNVFTRPPQVALFRIWRTGVGGSVYQEVYLSNNHFSSGPDRRVDQRTEQAAYNAAIVGALQAVDADVYASVGGDLNVYPRPDDPFPNDPSDQLAALYEQPMTNLWDIQVEEDPVSAYSYIYLGQSQTLDQMFVAPVWLGELMEAKTAHINADYPADFAGDGPRGTSDHDPMSAAYSLLPTLDRLEELVHYFDMRGDITGNQTTKILLDKLGKARRFYESGQMDAYLSMIEALALQVQDLAPEQISQAAADALAADAWMLYDVESAAYAAAEIIPPENLEIFIPLVVTNP